MTHRSTQFAQRSRRPLCAAPCALSALLAFGCARPAPPAPPPVVTPIGPSQRIMLEARMPDDSLLDPATGRVHLSGAVNAVVAFQLVISAGNTAAAGIELAMDDFALTLPPAATQPESATPAEVDSATPRIIPKDAVRMFRIWPMRIERFPNWYLRSIGSRRTREIPDALVPLDAPRNGQPFNLPPGEKLAVWIEIRVPRDARPGNYTAVLTVHAPAAGDIRLPLELNVRDVYLSPEMLLPVFAGVQLAPLLEAQVGADPANIRPALFESDGAQAVRTAFRILHEHGLSPYTGDMHPRLTQEVSGKVHVDWTDYDVFCAPLMEGTAYEDGRPAAGWPLPVDLQMPDPVQYDGLHAPAYAAVLKEYYENCASHFSLMGWLPRAWIWFKLAPGPEATSAQIADFRLVSNLLHPANPASPHLPIVSTLMPQSMRPFGWLNHQFEDLSAHADIWATPARFNHRATIMRQKAAGKKIWLAPDEPPYSGSLAIEAPPTHARSLPLQAYLEGADALFLPQTTDWPEKVFEHPITNQAPSNTWLLYPGDFFGLKEPVASLRLKQLQLGQQDVQLLRLLDVLGHNETARLLAGSLIKSWGTDAYGDNFLDGVFGRRIDDARVWHLARELLLDEVAFAVSDRPAQAINREANRAAWARFLSATRRVEVLPESTRLTLARRNIEDPLTGKPRPQRIICITHDVAIRSEIRSPVSGDLKLGALPPGGRPRQDNVHVGPLAEMEQVMRPLAWDLEGPLPCDLDGHFVQRIALESDTAGDVQADCVLSVVQTPELARPITIDGNLGDWLPSEFNSAGDFRLLTSAPPTPVTDEFAIGLLSAAARPRAISQTVAYFGHDKENLYIGLNAASPESAADVEARRITSDVEYDGLMPLGEDLIELMLDPTNRATRLDDLYHIIIKSNGIAVFEKGVAITPAICRRESWPEPAPHHAVQRTALGWSAEIVIPLRAFGQTARSPVWGLNIARLEPSRGEYSDWARAPRHIYTPRSMGNLIWPE